MLLGSLGDVIFFQKLQRIACPSSFPTGQGSRLPRWSPLGSANSLVVDASPEGWLFSLTLEALGSAKAVGDISCRVRTDGPFFFDCVDLLLKRSDRC